MLSNRCLSCLSICLSVCLSITLVYRGQTVGWIKMKLGMELGLDSGHIVLGRDTAPLPKTGTAPLFTVHACCRQTAGWIKMPLGTEVGLFLLDGDRAVPSSRGRAPNFLALVYCGQTAGWIKVALSTEMGLGPGHIVPYEDPSTISSPCPLWPNGWMHQVYCSQRAWWIKMPLGTEVNLGQATLCYMEAQLPPPQKRDTPQIFRPMSIVTKRPPISTFDALKRRTFSFTKNLKVDFSGEEAVDDGGQRREVLRYVNWLPHGDAHCFYLDFICARNYLHWPEMYIVGYYYCSYCSEKSWSLRLNEMVSSWWDSASSTSKYDISHLLQSDLRVTFVWFLSTVNTAVHCKVQRRCK